MHGSILDTVSFHTAGQTFLPALVLALKFKHSVSPALIIEQII